MDAKLIINGPTAILGPLTDVKSFRRGLNIVAISSFLSFYAILNLFEDHFAGFGQIIKVLLVLIFLYWLIFFPRIDDQFLAIKHDKNEGKIYIGNGKGEWLIKDVGNPRHILINRSKSGYFAMLEGDRGNAVVGSSVSGILPGSSEKKLIGHLGDYACWLGVEIINQTH